jgi:hypothetical protein
MFTVTWHFSNHDKITLGRHRNPETIGVVHPAFPGNKTRTNQIRCPFGAAFVVGMSNFVMVGDRWEGTLWSGHGDGGEPERTLGDGSDHHRITYEEVDHVRVRHFRCEDPSCKCRFVHLVWRN